MELPNGATRVPSNEPKNVQKHNLRGGCKQTRFLITKKEKALLVLILVGSIFDKNPSKMQSKNHSKIVSYKT